MCYSIREAKRFRVAKRLKRKRIRFAYGRRAVTGVLTKYNGEKLRRIRAQSSIRVPRTYTPSRPGFYVEPGVGGLRGVKKEN